MSVPCSLPKKLFSLLLIIVFSAFFWRLNCDVFVYDDAAAAGEKKIASAKKSHALIKDNSQ